MRLDAPFPAARPVSHMPRTGTEPRAQPDRDGVSVSGEQPPGEPGVCRTARERSAAAPDCVASVVRRERAVAPAPARTGYSE